MSFFKGVSAFVATLLASIILILLGIIYFGITLWIIKVASNIFFGAGLEANWAVLSATLLSVGAIIASASARLK